MSWGLVGVAAAETPKRAGVVKKGDGTVKKGAQIKRGNKTTTVKRVKTKDGTTKTQVVRTNEKTGKTTKVGKVKKAFLTLPTLVVFPVFSLVRTT